MVRKGRHSKGNACTCESEQEDEENETYIMEL